jgi:hypothetical protein
LFLYCIGNAYVIVLAGIFVLNLLTQDYRLRAHKHKLIAYSEHHPGDHATERTTNEFAAHGWFGPRAVEP